MEEHTHDIKATLYDVWWDIAFNQIEFRHSNFVQSVNLSLALFEIDAGLRKKSIQKNIGLRFRAYWPLKGQRAFSIVIVSVFACKHSSVGDGYICLWTQGQ